MVASASQSFGGRINGNQMFVHESIESTNCHAKDDLDCDTHIEMVLDPIKGDASARMIVEVTPRWRFPMSERGMDWAPGRAGTGFRDIGSRFGRWMLFDAEHQRDSGNTAPGRAGNWRATVWEIHPVTSIEVGSRVR